MRVSSLSRLLGVLGSLCLGLGCPAPIEPYVGPCGLDYLGSPQQSPSFTLTQLGPDMKSATLEQGASVSLHFAVQGGAVAYLGVGGAAHLDPCGVTLLAAVRDPVSHQVRLDSRTVNLTLDARGQGMSDEMDSSSFANVPLCPNQWSNQDVFDHDYELTLTLTDSQKHSATQTLTIHPACDVPGEVQSCRCMCRQGYKLGDPCPNSLEPGP